MLDPVNSLVSWKLEIDLRNWVEGRVFFENLELTIIGAKYFHGIEKKVGFSLNEQKIGFKLSGCHVNQMIETRKTLVKIIEKKFHNFSYFYRQQSGIQ